MSFKELLIKLVRSSPPVESISSRTPGLCVFSTEDLIPSQLSASIKGFPSFLIFGNWDFILNLPIWILKDIVLGVACPDPWVVSLVNGVLSEKSNSQFLHSKTITGLIPD